MSTGRAERAEKLRRFVSATRASAGRPALDDGIEARGRNAAANGRGLSRQQDLV
jgi:hypothetical protein